MGDPALPLGKQHQLQLVVALSWLWLYSAAFTSACCLVHAQPCRHAAVLVWLWLSQHPAVSIHHIDG